MRGPAIWAGVVFASVCVAQPATAQQMTFLQCGYDWSNGNHTDKVFAIHGSALLVWNPGAGDFLNACDPRDSFGATGASCIAIIGDYEITITTRTTSGFSMNLSIDRTTGRFQEFMPTSGLSAQGKCSRGADPRVAPRAF